MKINRHFVSFAPRALHPLCWLTAINRKAVQLVTLAINLLLLTVLLVVADHLPFVDVPSGSFYHNAVSALYGARITTGTTPTTFSPEDFVTRGQMAAFLHRGLGRVAYTEGFYASLPTIERELTLLRINTGGAAGGTGFLKVDAAFTTYNIAFTGCPCEIRFWLSAEGGPTSSRHAVTLDDRDSFAPSASGAVTMAFPLPTGNRPQNVRLFAIIGDTDGDVAQSSIWGKGSITAIWVPFGATGGNTLSAASAAQGEESQGTGPDAKPDAER